MKGMLIEEDGMWGGIQMHALRPMTPHTQRMGHHVELGNVGLCADTQPPNNIERTGCNVMMTLESTMGTQESY
jgi:hypothetical protein